MEYWQLGGPSLTFRELRLLPENPEADVDDIFPRPRDPAGRLQENIPPRLNDPEPQRPQRVQDIERWLESVHLDPQRGSSRPYQHRRRRASPQEDLPVCIHNGPRDGQDGPYIRSYLGSNTPALGLRVNEALFLYQPIRCYKRRLKAYVLFIERMIAEGRSEYMSWLNLYYHDEMTLHERVTRIL